MKVIGFLNSASDDIAFAKHVEAFRNGLKENGYVDGQNVQVISRWAEGDYASLPKLAADLVNSQVDLIATTGGTVSALAALKVTKTLPVLFVSGFDPGKAGLLKFGNATGVNVSTTQSVPERAQLLRQLVPKAAKIADLLRPKTFVYEREKEQAKKAKLIVVEAKSGEDDLRQAFANAVKQGAGALMVCADPYFTSQYQQIVALAREFSLPTAFAWRQYVEDGGLMSFGPRLSDAYFQIGAYAGLILKGIKPGALRVQEPKADEFELVVNGKTARTLNVEIPKGFDRRIEVI
jgi:putative tryptophan/tyrosine transport system substrate-binding protein